MNQVSTISDLVAGDSYYRELCDQLGVAVIATDADLNITLWNAAAGRLFGAASEQMRGIAIVTVFPAERRAVAERFLRRAIEQGEGSEFEFDYRDSAGNRREYAAAVAPVLSPAGERAGLSM